ncbi:MAG TPA: DUF58 domain-containing protein [Actinomycetota bacterium]
MKRRFTKRALSVSVVAVVLVLAGATAQAGWLYVLAAGVLGIVASSLLYRPRLGALEVQRAVPVRAVVGDEVRLRLSVTNTSRRSIPPFRIEDRYAAYTGVGAAACDRLGAEARAEIELRRVAHRRGVYDAGIVQLRCGAPFGFMRSTREVDVPSFATVVPSWVELRSFPILEPSSYPSDVLHERARTGAGEEFLGIRDYRPGDSPRAVHWRSTARTGHLMVREYEEHPSTRVGIVLVGGDHGPLPASSFETLVSAVASIAMYALSTGHPLELVRGESDGGVSALAEPEKEDALTWLAAARPADASPAPLVAHALGRLGRRGTLVVCAPTAGAAGAGLLAAVDHAQTAGARVFVVVAQSSTWTDEVVDEIDPASLAGGRARVRIARKDESLKACLEG